MAQATTYGQLAADLTPRSLAVLADALGMGQGLARFILFAGGFNGSPVDSIKDEVNDWAYRYGNTGLTTGIDNSETSITLDSATDALTGTYIMIDDELMYVSSGTGSNPITVVRAQRGSSAASHLADATVIILGVPTAEGHEWSTGTARTPVNYTNYVQEISRDVRVPDMVRDQAHVGLPGGQTDYLTADVEMTLKETMRLFNRSALYGRKHASTPQGSDSIIRTMDGVVPLMLLSGVDASGAALNKATHIDAALQQISDADGPAPTHMVMNGLQATKLENLLVPFNAGNPIANERFGAMVSSVVTTVSGPMGIIIDNDVRKDEILILHQPFVEFKPFGNLRSHALRFEPMGRQGLYDGGIVTGAYTLRVFGRAFAHTRIYGLATS